MDIERLATDRIHQSDPTYAVEALRAAWRGGALDDAAAWLDRLPEADRAAWLADVRSRLDLGPWLGGLDRATALRWLHRFVPWTEARVVQGATSQGRGGGVPLTEAIQWGRADQTLELTEPCGLPWPLAWSVRAAQLWSCDRAERAIDHAERVLPEWESRYPDDRRPREAIEAARAMVVAIRRGGAAAPSGARRLARAAAYDADYAAAYAARAAARAAFEAGDAAAYDAADAAARAARAAYGAAYDAAYAADYAADAATDAERAWQAERLWAYLCWVTDIEEDPWHPGE